MDAAVTIIAALIPARAGSQGVPQKNTRRIGSTSLVERAILAARSVKEIGNEIYVSTDDIEAGRQAMDLGVRTIARPLALATNETPMAAVIEHALTKMDPRPDIIALLQPTTPSRTWEMVQDAVQMLKRDPSVDSVVSVVPIPRTHAPEWVMCITDHQLYFYAPDPRPTRRQDVTQVYIRDGSVYAFRVAMFDKTKSIYGAKCLPYLLKPHESLNIDTPEDWVRAQQLLR